MKKVLLILSVLIFSGCSELNANITGEKYTIFVPELNHYKVNSYDIVDGVIYFESNGSKYKSNVWIVKTTKGD